jgi:hypothetical protein
MFSAKVVIGPEGILLADLVVDADQVAEGQKFFAALRPTIRALDKEAKNWAANQKTQRHTMEEAP